MPSKKPSRSKPRARPSTRRKKPQQRKDKAATDNEILAWENDPFAQNSPTAPPHLAAPIARPVPNLAATALPIAISGSAPPPRRYQPGTPEFRFWTAAEALRRIADFWAPLLPSGTKWHSTVGASLRVRLDFGDDLNAYYDRAGLDFFHGTAGRIVVYSGESPDVVCHEFGHAILDAVRPQLWDAAAAEPAAFHEAMGDISALLAALQLRSMRERVLLENHAHLYRSSQLSRMCEQLGWAIRQTRRDAVEPDCLRNAVNSFFYKDPMQLPPSAPASLLSSEPHSFSRVFTGAFFEALAGIFDALGPPTEALLQKASVDAAKLLLQAIKTAPVVPAYYSQVAAGMLRAAPREYHQALAGAFMRHGILSPESAQGTVAAAAGPSARAAMMAARPIQREEALPVVEISSAEYGLGVNVIRVHAAAEPKQVTVTAAAPDVGSLPDVGHDQAAKAFIEDLLRLGHLDLGQPVNRAAVATGAFTLAQPLHRKTHELRRTADGMTLKRLYFDCGFASCRHCR